MKQKVKILTINTVGLNRNGITTVIYDYYSLFRKEDFEIDIIAAGKFNKEVVEQFENAGLHVHYLPSRKENLLRYFWSLSRLIVKNHYTVIHVHGNSATMAIELFLARLLRCKIRIAHSHNSTCEAKKADKLLRPLFYKSYTHAFACGKLAGEWLFPNRKFLIIKNGRDIGKYKYNPELRTKIRAELQLSDTTLTVGHIGNFNEQKNHFFLIRIFEQLKKKNNDCKLFLAGYGHCEDSVRKLVRDLGLEKDVVFMGMVNNVNEVLQAMDVMALPSLYEGLPLVVIEWQIAALPSIVSDVVTRECAYTDLVKFESLNDNYDSWANEILRLFNINRNDYADKVVTLTRENGYDISKNVEDLMVIIENES